MSAKKTDKPSSAELRALRDARFAAQADPAEQMRRTLESHERAIEHARRSFVAMGRALLAIRTERLYSGEFSSFAEYLEARWDVSEAYANRTINAALVAIEATPIGVEINSEAVARELVGLDPEALKAVWDEATRRAAGGRVTAALVKEVRRGLEPPKAPVLEGEIVDGDPRSFPRENSRQSDLDEPAADPLESFPEVENALNDFHNNQSSGPVPTSPGGGSGENHQDAKPGEAEGPAPAADVNTPSAPTATPEESPASDASGVADEPERAGAGVSPPAPATKPAKREESEEEQRARVEREMREARSLEFATGLVNVRMRLEPDPIRWYHNVYIHGLYHARDLPRVRDSFTPTGMRQAARFLNELADHLEALGEEL